MAASPVDDRGPGVPAESTLRQEETGLHRAEASVGPGASPDTRLQSRNRRYGYVGRLRIGFLADAAGT